MKILILNGSPRKDGNTAYIIKKLCNYADCTVISSYFEKYSPCCDCRSCIESGKCIYSDNIVCIIDNIDKYDAIVLASPLYYNQPTGSLLNMVSRFQLIFNTKRSLNKKVGGIIVTGGGDTIVNSADAEKTMRIVLRGLNINSFCYIRSLHTSTIPAWEDKTIDRQISEFINYLKSEIRK